MSAADTPVAPQIPVGIGACLRGHAVRYDGSHKKTNGVIEQLATCFELRPFCPEVAIGHGVPRPTIRLVGAAEAPRAVDSATGTRDVTDALRAYGQRIAREHADLCGYILVKGSPSCGFERVKRYDAAGHPQPADATGIFARALMEAMPLLPVEDDGRLHDEHLRESFVARVYTCWQWRQLCNAGLTHTALLAFYARHKYLVMSRDVSAYKTLGPLLANAKCEPLEQLAPRVIALILDALKAGDAARPHQCARTYSGLPEAQDQRRRKTRTRRRDRAISPR